MGLWRKWYLEATLPCGISQQGLSSLDYTPSFNVSNDNKNVASSGNL